MSALNNSEYNLKIFENTYIIKDKNLKLTLEVQDGLIVEEKFLNTLVFEMKNINTNILKMLNERKMSVFVVYKFSDLYTKQSISQNYGYKIDFNKESRGLMSDEINKIVLFSKNLQPANIGAILYHEIGHFIDCYKNFKTIKDLHGFTYSTNIKFIRAYKSDFKKNFKLIKNDANPRLRHFVQDNTLEKINQITIAETFAELFSLAFNKANDTKTVELYFPGSLIILKELLNDLMNDYNIVQT